MIRALRSIRFRLAFALLLLVAGGAPHPAAAVPADPALAAFLAMGGQLSDMCGDPSMPATHLDCRHCDACRIFAALPPDPPAGSRASRAEPAAETIERAAAPRATRHGIPPRGPPPAG